MTSFKPCQGKTACRDDGRACLTCGRSFEEIEDTRRLIDALADLAIPVASYSEYAGSVINCDNVLQSFAKALTKNNDLADICTITVQLGGPLASPEERFAVLQQAISALKDFEPNKIPAQGLNLNDSEAANVTA